MSDINVQELANKAIEELKKSPEKLKTFAANNEVLKGILGDDGKLGLDDLQKVANAAKVAGENLIDKAKDLFSK